MAVRSAHIGEENQKKPFHSHEQRQMQNNNSFNQTFTNQAEFYKNNIQYLCNTFIY